MRRDGVGYRQVQRQGEKARKAAIGCDNKCDNKYQKYMVNGSSPPVHGGRLIFKSEPFLGKLQGNQKDA